MWYAAGDAGRRSLSLVNARSVMSASIRTALVFAAALFACFMGQAAAQTRKPNVIVFLSDDVGYGEYGFQGNKEIPTPHIDSIAKNGVRFTQGYVSRPVLQPDAGRPDDRPLPDALRPRVQRRRRSGGQTFGLPLTETTIADRLKALGYATCCHRQVAPRERPRIPADRSAASTSSTARSPTRRSSIRRTSSTRASRDRRAAGRGRQLLHDRRLRRAGRRLDRASTRTSRASSTCRSTPSTRRCRRRRSTSTASRTSPTRSGARSPP